MRYQSGNGLQWLMSRIRKWFIMSDEQNKMIKKVKFLFSNVRAPTALNSSVKRSFTTSLSTSSIMKNIVQSSISLATINKFTYSTHQPPANIQHKNIVRVNYAYFEQLGREELQKLMEEYSLRSQNYLVQKVQYLRQSKKQLNFNHQNNQSQTIDLISLVNIQIALTKIYHSKRYRFLAEQDFSQSTSIEIGQCTLSANQTIFNSITSVISTLHYIVSSQDFNREYQSQYPFIGRLVRVLVQVLQMQSISGSQLEKELLISTVELLDLYLNTFVHLVGNPIEHLCVYEALDSLTRLQLNYSSHEITTFIKDKYTKKNPSTLNPQQITFSHPILYHKSFALPQNKYSLSSKPEFNYQYSDINQSYLTFFKDLLSNGVINSQVNPYVRQQIVQKIDNLLDQGNDYSGNRDQLIQGSAVYVECLRTLSQYAGWKEQIYEDSPEKFLALMARLGFLVGQMDQFFVDVYQRRASGATKPSIFQIITRQNLFYVLYFSFTMLKNLKQSSFLNNLQPQQAQTLCSFGQQLIYQVSTRQNQRGFEQVLFGQVDNPKLECVQLELFADMLNVEGGLGKNDGNGTHECGRRIMQQMVAKLATKRYAFHPYIYLTWFYERSLDVLQQLSLNPINTQIDFNTLRQQLLFTTVQSIVSNPVNKLSHTNQIHSLFVLVDNLIKFKSSVRRKTDYQQELISKLSTYLNSHTKKQLLTQKEDDLCELFGHLLPAKGTFASFLSHVTQISFGEFKWESFNKLYFYSCLYLKNQNQRQITQHQNMNMEYVRRYILNEYNAMGISRREIPTNSYFYKILEIQTPASFYKNYFQNHGQRY